MTLTIISLFYTRKQIGDNIQTLSPLATLVPRGAQILVQEL